jgi:alpha-beta hydrolase superfamily lysophospholipase
MVLHLPRGPAPRPCVVACHGLSASKDSDKYLLLAERLTRAGLALARFDFQGCGESTGVEAKTTVATRIADAAAVLARLRGHPRLDGRFGLLGSSMGGFVALHVAAVSAGSWPVVSWNAPANLLDLAPPERREDGTGIGAALLAEVAQGRYAETPAAVARHLVIQGEADDVVAPSHAAVLHARAREPRALILIPGADHRLTDPAHRERAVHESLAWFRLAWR